MQHCTGLGLELTEGHLDDCLQVGELAQVSIGQLAQVGLSLGGDQAIDLQHRTYISFGMEM